MRQLLCALLLVLPATAQARTLHWSAFDVDARLDAEGVLHVTERQTMVFDGDWNGGERVFEVRPGQRLRLHQVTRIDPESGQRVELSRGSLDHVDDWDWASRHHLRWRSRLATDPPFEHQTLVYILEYSLGRILRQSGGFYHLDHDFAFPDRAGVIEAFSLDLEVDPAWLPQPGFEGRVEMRNLAPGQQAIVNASFAYAGDEAPAAVERAIASHKVTALFLGVFCLVGIKLSNLWRGEKIQGRFARPRTPDPIPRGWLQENLFDLLPEEAGALWDQRVGASEVAAVIARMVAEDKVASRVEEAASWWRRPTLELELRTDRSTLEGYERKLIDKLFFGGREKTDTKAIQKHYRSTGFDPASAIRPGITKRLERLPGGDEKLLKASWKPTFLLALLCLALLFVEGALRGFIVLGPLVAAAAIVLPIPVLWAYGAAAGYRKRISRPLLGWLSFLVPIALLGLGCFAIAWSGAGGREILPDLRPGLFGILALAALALVLANSVLNLARTRERRAIVARRQALAVARRHLGRQLKSPVPDLDDAWFPYILAFGLSKKADAWAKSHGPASSGSRAVTTSTWSGSGSPSWSGGGGAFGGAGATAAWTVAATGMASGVSPPSSSGSSGGGSSSGGGGGGGW